MIDATREEFCDLASGGPAVVRGAAEMPAVEPLAAYAALAEDGPAFLLESGGEKIAASDPGTAFRPEEGEDRHARFSFVGYEPDALVAVGPEDRVELLREDAPAVEPGEGDVLDRLRGVLPELPRRGFPDHDRQRFEGGLVGFLAYDAVYDLWLEEVGVGRPDTDRPDAAFLLNTRTLVFDHAADAVRLVFTPVVDGDPGDAYDALVAEAERVAETLRDADVPTNGGFEFVSEQADPREAYEAAVRQTKQHVLDGDIYQGVISRRRVLSGEVDSLALYEALRRINPSPYMYHLDLGERAVVGASPETFVSVRGEEVVSNPIAGTCPRGESPVEDRRLAGEMLADGKERAEHTMLVDLARNDVRRVAEPGSVRVPEFMGVLKYSHVQHIESTVTGTLAGDADAFDAARATFPAGTLSGAPKVRAMEIIDDLETEPRGAYGGGLGYVSWTGDADFAIVIRSAMVERGAGDPDRVVVQAGAGIVADSDPTREYRETEEKMGGVLAALDAVSDARIEADTDAGDPAAEAER
jgi:anthranilate synthase component 1